MDTIVEKRGPHQWVARYGKLTGEGTSPLAAIRALYEASRTAKSAAPQKRNRTSSRRPPSK